MDDLIKRLESATEGSRELDAEIARAVGLRDVHFDGDFGVGVLSNWFYATGLDADGGPWKPVPHYTTSLDAALSLVPEGYSWGVRHSGYGAADAEIWNPARRPGFYSDAVRVPARNRTPALALCIAALKARKESR